MQSVAICPEPGRRRAFARVARLVNAHALVRGRQRKLDGLRRT